MVAGKKAIEFRVIIIAIIALVALGFAFLIYTSLAAKAGGQVSQQAGAADVTVPNIYDMIAGISGFVSRACYSIGGFVILPNSDSENEVCWTPPSPYGGDTQRYESSEYSCGQVGIIGTVVYDLGLQDSSDVFVIKSGAGNELKRVVGPAHSNVIDDLSADAATTVRFQLSTEARTHSFSDGKGVKVNSISCVANLPDYKAGFSTKDLTITFTSKNVNRRCSGQPNSLDAHVTNKDKNFDYNTIRAQAQSCGDIAKEVTFERGNYRIRVCADERGEVDEYDETNNCVEADITLP